MWANEVNKGPKVDLTSSFLEKEHVVNHSEPNDLRSSVEETLKGSTGSKTSLSRCLGGCDDHNAIEQLRPKKGWESTKTINLEVNIDAEEQKTNLPYR